MKTRRISSRLIAMLMTAACFSAVAAYADTSTYDNKPTGVAEGPQPVGPSINNEAWTKLRAECEKDVPSGKTNGDVCVEAAALMLSSDLPNEFREFKEDHRIKIALRLLERGVDSSNLARARAYDYYSRIGFLGLSPYADSYRADELMEMMDKSGYPGGTLRRIRSQSSIIAFGTNDVQKREGCNSAKKMLADGKLDGDSTIVAKEIVATAVCTGFDQPPPK
ncbi:MAG: hypothetical protein JWN94_2685 [Betaproteobacteria bacterium]|nr:hypothetical protein [Betaproteobacteria bacterium]